jgi:hypothetical protein
MGALGTRHSLRPLLIWGEDSWQSSGTSCRENEDLRHVIARSEATKQSILSLHSAMDCFAALAMTLIGHATTSPVITREGG